jgi:HD-like signal output (HDOD) protein
MKILFVDDETHILRSLQRLMLRRPYEATFADNGHDALRLLDSQPFDAVVSDMMMPEMNGYDLLMKIRETHPSVARIIISGYAQAELVQRAIMQGIAAAYLLKPLNIESLVSVLEQCRVIREALSDDKVHEVVLSIGRLPVLSDRQQTILDVLNGNCNADELSQTIEQDPVVTTNILRLANSAFYGRSYRVGSVKDAVVCVGVTAIRTVVLTFSIIDETKLSQAAAERIRAIWDNSLKISRLTHALHQAITGKALPDIARSMGLVHDIGILLMETRLSDRMDQMFATCSAPPGGGDLEHRFFAADHARIGGYLLDYWSFPHILVAAALYHHHPFQQPLSEENQLLLALLHITDRYVWRSDNRHPLLNQMPEDERAYAYLNKSKAWVIERLNHESNSV